MTHKKAPDLDLNEANYAHCQVTEILPIPANEFFDWYMKEPPESFMLGTLVVPPIVSTEVISKEKFGTVGSARFFKFKDGTVAYEEVLSANFPEKYSYLPYGYDNPIHFLSDHAKSTMRVEADGENTRVIWDYAFHAKNKFTLPLVKLFVSLDWKRYLTNGLTVIRSHLETHGTSKQIHEVVEFEKAA